MPPHAAWTRYTQHASLSFVDAWVIAQAHHFKDDAWSYDTHLLRASKP